jgi:catechol 2,3-dioxygenase-like lactoylglutathione lyase family enzyme
MTALHHASITTADLDRLRDFYCRHFGFVEVLATQWAPGTNLAADAIFGLRGTAVRMSMLRSANAFLELFEFAAPVGKAGDPARPVNDAGLTHICLCVDDVNADYARLKAVGMVFNCPPQAVPGLCIATYGRDPDGNLVELMQPDPSGPFAMPAVPG